MTVLDDIVAGVREDLERRRRDVPDEVVADLARARRAGPDAHRILADRSRVHLLCEVKRASPSRGELAAIVDPADLAALYEEGGARAISVLTEERRFRGSLQDLAEVRARVEIPVLRKDFVVDPYQIAEARSAGADLVLLIVAALDDPTLRDFIARIEDLGMHALVEAHTAEEADRAVAAGARIIGVNARNLKTLEIDRDAVTPLLAQLPAGTVKIAESGVASADDVAAYVRAGADAVLVGEALVISGAPAETVAAFQDAGDAALAERDRTTANSAAVDAR